MTAASGRRRRAERARVTSDLTRSRGLFAGVLAGGLALLALLVVRDGPRALVAPGPLARPHAAVACASCHAEGTARATCGGCHAPHPSSRSPHRNLAAAGTLSCGSCHTMHGSGAGLAFEPNGAVTVFGSGFEHALVPATPPATRVHAPKAVHPPDAAVHAPNAAVHPPNAAVHAPDAAVHPPDAAVPLAPTTTFVPLIAAAACAECHELENPRDPASACVGGAGEPFSLCFDEHRRPATRDRATSTERDATVERARTLARSPAVSAALGGPRRLLAQSVPVTLALGGSLLVAFVVRRRAATRPNATAVRVGPPGLRRLPVIDAARCLGCQACVDACPYDALGIRRYVAVLERPDACCGAGPCVESCPNGSLTLVEGDAPASGPRLSAELEVPGRPGVFLAGDVTGSSLIRNAVRQGVAVARTVGMRIAREGAEREGAAVDLLVIGAGPAGLAAGLTARELGLRVTLLDQAGTAASIRRFSRQKLVLDAAASDGESLPLWLGDACKEELLERWERAIRRARLDVRAGVRATGIERSGSGALPFRVGAELPDGTRAQFAAKNVLVAVGTRGTPRPLDVPVPEEAVGRVHYELSDARAFAGLRVVVVGLGDVAMESALALAAQSDTHVTIVHRGSGFARGARRNIDAVARLAAKGRIRLVLAARVAAVRAASLEIEKAGMREVLAFEALFVHVGAVPAAALLETCGRCDPA